MALSIEIVLVATGPWGLKTHADLHRDAFLC